MPEKQTLPAPKIQKTSQLKAILALLWPQKRYLTVGFLAMGITTVCMLSLPQYLRHIFDNALTMKDMQVLNGLMGGMFGLTVLLVVAMYARTFFIQYAGSRMITAFRQKLFSHVLRLDLETFEKRSAGEIISRLLSDTVVMREFVQTALPLFIRGALLTVGTIIALFLTSWRLSSVLFFVVMPIIFVAIYLGKSWRKYAQAIQDNSAKIGAHVEEVINAMRTVKTYNQEAREEKAVHALMDNALAIAKRLVLSWAGFMSFNVFVGFIGVMAVLYLGGREVILGHMSLGAMMAYLLYLAFLGDGANSLGTFWPAFNNVLGASKRVFELLEEKPSITDKADVKLLPTVWKKDAPILEVEKVTFAYPARPEENALKALSFTVKEGEFVALVGESGAGKSTIFSVLMRLYSPQKGQVLVKGRAWDTVAISALRAEFSYVSQDISLFSTTITENIRYARPEATDAEVIVAAKKAHAHQFIQEFSMGYDMQVGSNGVRLSGGQKQRIAVARAFLKDAPIILLDEATSHLDAKSEQIVQTALADLGKGKTVIAIAHRLATVKNAHKIIVLDKGRAVAEGTHAELMTKNKAYKKLATLQFLGE